MEGMGFVSSLIVTSFVVFSNLMLQRMMVICICSNTLCSWNRKARLVLAFRPSLEMGSVLKAVALEVTSLLA